MKGGSQSHFPGNCFFSNPSSNPTIPACVAQIEIPFPFFYCIFFMNPSPSAQNPISQPLKKANPSSHFTPSRPSTKEATDELQCKIHLFIWTSHKFCRKAGVSMECWVLSRFKMNGRRIIEWLSVLQDFFFLRFRKRFGLFLFQNNKVSKVTWNWKCFPATLTRSIHLLLEIISKLSYRSMVSTHVLQYLCPQAMVCTASLSSPSHLGHKFFLSILDRSTGAKLYPGMT